MGIAHGFTLSLVEYNAIRRGGSTPRAVTTSRDEWFAASDGGYVAQACSFCNSFKIASPICEVFAVVIRSDLMSAVRRPLASTAAIAASTLSASAPMSKEYRRAIPNEAIIAIGLARPLPAISGA